MNFFSGWALIQIPELLRFAYRHVKKVLRASDQARVSPRKKRQMITLNENASNRTNREMIKARTENNPVSMGQKNENFDSEQCSKLKTYSESQLESLRAELRQLIKDEIIDALKGNKINM